MTDGSPEQGEHLTGEQGGLSGHEMMQIRAQLREVYREDYAVLPVLVRVEWSGAKGPGTAEARTILVEY